jgi:lactate racemase
MANYYFKYGETKYNIDINEEHIIGSLLPRDSKALQDVSSEVAKVLDNPIGTKPLNSIVRPGEKVLVIVSDITRLWIRTDKFLVYIIDYLNKAGIKDGDIEILIALGTHRPSTEDEKKLILGETIYNRVSIHDHDCFDDSKLCYLGESSFKTPIYINEKVIKADRVILTGGIMFHLFAGFGGGAKSMVPGVAGVKTIQSNHRLAFFEGENTGLNPSACSNRIIGNPMREDITEICKKVNPDFLFNVVLDSEGNFVKFVAGDFEKAWEKGCDTIRDLYGIGIEEKADIIIASAGGYPKDINLYQTVKTMDNCLYGSKENSVIILLSECREGLGAKEFLSWFIYKTLEDMERALKKDFTVPGYAAYKTAYIARYRKLILISSLDENVVKELGFEPCKTVEEALQRGYQLSGANPKIILMPFGGNTLPIFGQPPLAEGNI